MKNDATSRESARYDDSASGGENRELFVAGSGNGVFGSRRDFLKSSGGATAATMLALHGMRVDLLAQDTWESKSESAKGTIIDLDAAGVDSALTNLLDMAQLPTGATKPTLAEWKQQLGWAADHTIKVEVSAKVTWQEKTSGSGPIKYRRVSWEYGGNQLDNWPGSAGQYRSIAMIEGYAAGDEFKIGGITITAAIAQEGFNQTGGHEHELSVGHEYKTRFGTVAANGTVQPQSVFTDDATFEVESFSLIHNSPVKIWQARIPLVYTDSNNDPQTIDLNWSITTTGTPFTINVSRP